MRINTHDGHTLHHRLSYEEPVERVFVIRRQALDFGGVIQRDG
jgi:hypothetical protein